MNTTNYYFGNTIKLAILSDFHDDIHNEIINNLKENKPDLICIPGDLVYGDFPVSKLKIEESIESYRLIQECVKVAPTFMSLGNHEWMLTEEDINIIKNVGVTILDNNYIHFKNLVIGGLTSFKVIDFRKTQRIQSMSRLQRILSNKKEHFLELDWLKDFEKEDGIKILLSHHPEDVKVLRNYKIHFILSGHAHGGQWRYYDIFHKKWKGIFAPDQGFFPKYSEGIHETTYGKMIISRGLSNTVEPIPRFNNPKEIIYLHI